ncbi:MAG TPA: outer membrane beta-barrel protein [Gemmatimonadaceae bacterium]|nr:outer membrane beta-barrel protein [Gemmatimonadaceae bacterium]
MTKRLTAVLAALVFSASAAASQTPRPLELGVDAAVTVGLGDNAETVVDLPAQAVRVGFPMTSTISLEPKLGLTLISGDGDTFTSYRAELGLLYHLNTMRSGTYIRPFVGLTGFSSGDDDVTHGLIGAGVGIKVPLRDRFGSRFEANFAHAFGDGSFNQIGLLAGLSFFTR